MNDTTTPAEQITQTHFVAEGALPLLENRLKIIGRAAAKVNAVFSYAINRHRFVEEEVKQPNGKPSIFIRKFEVSLTGTKPCYNGWNFRGTVEHTADGNVLRLVPGVQEVPEAYRNNKPCCDHCQVNRVRRDTYIVQHEGGEFKQVGSNCLKDFLGHKNPQEIARLASLWMSLAEMVASTHDGGTGGLNERRRVDLIEFLTRVAVAVRVSGRFISRKQARESAKEIDSTSAIADTLINVDEGRYGLDFADRMHANYPIPDADRKMAKDARDYVLGRFSIPLDDEAMDTDDYTSLKGLVMDLSSAKEGLSDFEHNLFVVAKGLSVEDRTTGIAAYIIQYFRKETGLIPESKPRPVSNYVGSAKERLRDLTITVEKIIPVSTEFGTMDIIKMADTAGNTLVWKTGSGHGLEETHTYQVDATVRAHSEYKGARQTLINRVTVKAGTVAVSALQAA